MTLYEALFEMALSISSRWPSLNPIAIRRQKAAEVFLLVQRVNARDDRKDSESVIRRPASDDWY